MFILMKGNTLKGMKAVNNPWSADGSATVGSFDDCREALFYLVRNWGAVLHEYTIYELTEVDRHEVY